VVRLPGRRLSGSEGRARGERSARGSWPVSRASIRTPPLRGLRKPDATVASSGRLVFLRKYNRIAASNLDLQPLAGLRSRAAGVTAPVP
jgi:hypothetical protein